MALTMNPLLFSCSGNRPLAEAVATVLGLKVGDCILERFPDGEMRVEVLEDVRERDVYLIQSMRPPAEQYLLELLLLADACLRAGALRLTAVQGVVGTVRGCSPIIVDDMISTGGTIEAAIRALVDAGCTQEITVSVTHPLLVGDAIERLGRLPGRRLVISDSVPLPREPVASVDRVTLAPLLGEAIRRMSSGVQMAHAR